MTAIRGVASRTLSATERVVEIPRKGSIVAHRFWAARAGCVIFVSDIGSTEFRKISIESTCVRNGILEPNAVRAADIPRIAIAVSSVTRLQPTVLSRVCNFLAIQRELL